MKNFSRILVVIEPRQMRQPALERALAVNQYARLRRARGGRDIEVKITAVLPVFDFSWELTSILSVEQEKDLHQSVIEKHRAWLKAYLDVNAMGVEIEQEVVWAKHIGQEITRVATEHACEVIIKSSDVHGMLDSVIFTPLDWQLLRHSPVPVMIAKDHMWSPSGTIAVAVDLSNPDDRRKMASNLRKLREAQELALFTGCNVHLVYAIPPIVAPMPAMPGFIPEIVNEEGLKEGMRQAFAFAGRHKIAPENVHVRAGHADEVIPKLCSELKPTALILGTAARTGLSVAVVGNICERVIDSLDCDVMVITPKAVTRQLPHEGSTGDL